MRSFNFGWKSILALGASVATVIFAVKMDAEAVERVSIRAIDAAKECVIALKSDR